MSNWVCPFGNSRMACASHTFSKSVCPIFQSRNNLLRQKAKFFPIPPVRPRKAVVSEGSSLCLMRKRRLQPLPLEMGPRNTRKGAKKLRDSHRGHGGHRGNIKVVCTRPAPNFSLSLKIILCDLCVSLPFTPFASFRVFRGPISSSGSAPDGGGQDGRGSVNKSAA